MKQVFSRFKHALAVWLMTTALGSTALANETEGDQLPAFGLQSVNGVELGMTFGEAAAVLEEAGFTRDNGKDTCLAGTPDVTGCYTRYVRAGKTQTGEQVTYLARQSTRFTKEEVQVDLMYTSAELGALVYGVKRKEEFGRYVVDFAPVQEQIAGRVGAIYNQQPCSKRGGSDPMKSFIFDANWNYVKVGRNDVPGTYCGGIGFAPINGSAPWNAQWTLEQPEGSIKYQATIQFLLNVGRNKIRTFDFELFDNELAAQNLTAAHLAALEALTPEKNLSKDF